MSYQDEGIKKLTEEFKKSQKILLALGDENRQHLIVEMIQMGKCNGVRVNEITQNTYLSRPAVSHHLKILKEAGLLKMRKEGTKNYYYFDADMVAMNQLILMLIHAKQIMNVLPDRSE
ncbi:MAG: ArsR/SmtB family transcription factor [Traorella sp.]